MEKTITLKFTDYVIMGNVVCNMWGGGQGEIDMESYHVNSIDDLTEIIDGVNDNGFGVESYEEAYIKIYENYEGHLVYREDFWINMRTKQIA